VDLSKYQELTGNTVSSAKTGFYQAQINRTKAMLETMLGFTLNPDNVQTNLYNELGKSRDDCACSSAAIQENADLDDPDEVTGAYRLFPYNHLDQFFHVDPFTAVHKVKLVWVKQGTGDNGVTIRTFDQDRIRVDMGRDGIGKYVELCHDCLCVCDCQGCVQLAVDADWLWDDPADLPLDLLYVWADMVTHYSDQKKDIKSESITTHSYTKFDRVAPETEPHNLSVIKKYAGPHGSATVMPTTGAAGRRVTPWL
jgi:hypothetical protein